MHGEVDAVEMLDERDDVAADVAAAAIEDCLAVLIEKRSSPPHFGHGPQRSTPPRKLDPAPLDLTFDRNGAGFIRPRVEGV